MQIDDVTWKLLGNVLYSDDVERRNSAFLLLRTVYADKDKRLTLKALYKSDFNEFNRVDQMDDDEYQEYLIRRYN